MTEYDDENDGPPPFASFPIKTLAAFLDKRIPAQASIIQEIRDQIAPSEVLDTLRRDEKLNEEQIRQLLKFELLRQDSQVSGKPLKNLVTTLESHVQQNKKAIEDKREMPWKDPLDYIEDTSNTFTNGIRKPKMQDVWTMELGRFKEAGISVQDVVFMLEHNPIADVVDEFNRTPPQRSYNPLLNRTKTAIAKKAEEALKVLPYLTPQDTADILGYPSPENIPLAKPPATPFAEQFFSMAMKEGAPLIAKRMAISKEDNSLTIVTSPFGRDELLEKILVPLQALAEDSGRTFTFDIRSIAEAEDRPRNPHEIKISGDALVDYKFLHAMRERIFQNEQQKEGRWGNL